MAWTVILEHENKGEIDSLSEELSLNNVENLTSQPFKLLKYLHPYGDTIYNSLQMTDLISDLTSLKEIERNHQLINDLIGLAQRCQKEVHCYMAFYGD